jgi:hypothetical protein
MQEIILKIVFGIILFGIFLYFSYPYLYVTYLGIRSLFDFIRKKINPKESSPNPKILKKSAIETYNRDFVKVNIPDKCLKVNCKNGEFRNDMRDLNSDNFWTRKTNILMGINYFWKSDDCLYFYPTIDCIETNRWRLSNIEFKIATIRIDEIQYFQRVSKVFSEKKISGGGGGGSSIGNAILGGAIAGPVGAIIASRKKIDPIKIEKTTNVVKSCILCYFRNGFGYLVSFDYDDYKVFNEYIPDKEYYFVKDNTKINTNLKESIQETNVIQKIRELGNLKDEGLITQEEFDEKKKELLKKV